MAESEGRTAATMAAFGLRRDPSQPVVQVEVENEILRLCEKLEMQGDELTGRGIMAAEAEANHKAKRAVAFLQAEGTDAKRTATAEAHVHEDYQKRLAATAVYESLKEAIRSTRTQLDALRTIAANIRSQT